MLTRKTLQNERVKSIISDDLRRKKASDFRLTLRSAGIVIAELQVRDGHINDVLKLAHVRFGLSQSTLQLLFLIIECFDDV